jgi:uncharacterized protein
VAPADEQVCDSTIRKMSSRSVGFVSQHDEAAPNSWRAPLKWYNFYTSAVRVRSRKSAANKAKHGIDFIEAQAIWTDPDRLEIPARSVDEPRFQVIGRINEKTWSAFITYRHETIRIISVRRARSEEEARYLAN